MKINSLLLNTSATNTDALVSFFEESSEVHLQQYCTSLIAFKSHYSLDTQLVVLVVDATNAEVFDMLPSLINTNRCQLIVCSTLKKYAFNAYKLGASHFIHWPINTLDLTNVVTRAKDYTAYLTYKTHYLAPKITIKFNLTTVDILLHSIIWVESLGDYVKIITDTTSYVTLLSMKKLLEKLPSEYFVRIHKTYIVNLYKVTRYSTTTVHINTQILPLSRKQKPVFFQAMANIS